MHLLLTIACDSAPAVEPSVTPILSEQGEPVSPSPMQPVGARVTTFETALLEVDSEVAGMGRGTPVDLGPLEAPDLAMKGGEPWVVAVDWTGQDEHIVLVHGDHRETVWSGARAWAPRIEVSGDDVWLTWCGREGAVGLFTDIYLQRVGDTPERITAGEGRACMPDVVVDEGGQPHLAWESERGIATWSRESGVTHHAGGWLARRPALLWDEGLWLAWDEYPHLRRSGNTDPQTRVMLRRREAGSWSDPLVVDQPQGIAAAPRLLPHPQGVMVAYHRSLPMGVVKWPALRLVRGTEVLEAEPVDVPVPTGENQGAEFPEPVLTSGGGVVLVSRSSQGALVSANAQGWDLTRAPWGARGLKVGAAVQGRTLTIVRKARRATVMETLTLPEVAPPKFRTVPTVEQVHPATRPANTTPPFFGDVHMHSATGDGTGPPDEVYARAVVRGLDFAVMTEHDFVLGSRLFPSEQEEIAWLTELFNTVEHFTTLHAYEWTTPPLFREGSGHRNAYFKGFAPSPAPSHKGEAPDTKALWAALDGQEVFTAPHHTTWTGTVWEDADPSIQRHLEIVSVHGLSEAPWQTEIPPRGDQAEGFAVVGLETLPFGFLGGSDAHGLLWHHGIGRKEDPWACGLTGVLSEENSRVALWNAMYARHTFATSGSRTSAVVTLGESTNGDPASPGLLSWTAVGTELSQLQVVVDGEVVHTESLSGRSATGTWDLNEFHTVYIRVVDQVDGLPELAWSSPLFAMDTP